MNATTPAPDLTRHLPRGPRVRIGGYVLVARFLERAAQNSPPTRATAKSSHGCRSTRRTNVGRVRASIGAPFTNERGPDVDMETLEIFASRVGPLSKTREDVKTRFDYLDLDDHATFGGKA